MPLNRLSYVVVASLLTLVAVDARPSDPDYCAADPYADPKADLCNPLRYIPHNWASGLAFGLYMVVTALLSFQLYKHGHKYMLALVIGSFCEGIGLMLRIPLRSNLHSTGIYVVEYLFVVLSPCALLAADYIILGRLSQHLDGSVHLRPINPRYLMRIFVGSDILTFLIQAAGGGLSTSHNTQARLTGSRIFLAGLALQLVSFAIFTFLWAVFGYRIHKNDRALWDSGKGKGGWVTLYWAIGWTCIGFLTRSVYRTIELSEGYTGHLATTEWYFYVFDTLPLWLGICAYIPFWPPKYMTESTRVIAEEPEVVDMAVVGDSAGTSVGEEATAEVKVKV